MIQFLCFKAWKKIGMSWQFKQKRLNCLESIIILVNTLLSKNVPLPIVLSRMISVFFYNSIILLTCVKWVKTLKWQQHLEETWEMTVEPPWDKEALNPLQCAQPSIPFFSYSRQCGNCVFDGHCALLCGFVNDTIERSSCWTSPFVPFPQHVIQQAELHRVPFRNIVSFQCIC